MLKIRVLGAAAGGGVPQWNCNCEICASARSGDGRVSRSTQASLAFSADDRNWFLINASPDLREQIAAAPQLQPREGLRDTPIAGVLLTNGEVDAVAGLLNLREGSPFTVYAHSRVLETLRQNSIFDVLSPAKVRRESIEVGRRFLLELPDGASAGIEVTAFEVPGKVPLYLEGASAAEAPPGDTLGLHVRDLSGGMSFVCITACAALTPALVERLRQAPLVFFDGTLWQDDEMIRAGLSQKTGKRMGHISMAGADGTMELLDGLDIGRRLFIHINNSNRALLRDSAERAELERRGWEIPADGMEISL